MIRIAALLRAANPVPRTAPRPPLDSRARAELFRYVPPSTKTDDGAPRLRPSRTARWVWVGATVAGATALTLGMVFLVPGAGPTASADIATARVVEGFPAPTADDPEQWTAGAVVQLDEPDGTTRLVKVWVQPRAGDEWAQQGDELTYRRSDDGLWIAENHEDDNVPPAAVIPALTVDRDNGAVRIQLGTGPDAPQAPIAPPVGGGGVELSTPPAPSGTPSTGGGDESGAMDRPWGEEGPATDDAAPMTVTTDDAAQAEREAQAIAKATAQAVAAAEAEAEAQAQADRARAMQTLTPPPTGDAGGGTNFLDDSDIMNTPLTPPSFQAAIPTGEPVVVPPVTTDVAPGPQITVPEGAVRTVPDDDEAESESESGAHRGLVADADAQGGPLGSHDPSYAVMVDSFIAVHGVGPDAVPWFLRVFTPPVDLDGQLVTAALGTTAEDDGAAVFYAQADGDDLNAMRSALARLDVTPDGEWTDPQLRGLLTSPAEARRGRALQTAPSPVPDSDASPDSFPGPSATPSGDPQMYTDGSQWTLDPSPGPSANSRSWSPRDVDDCITRVAGATEDAFVRITDGDRIVCVDVSPSPEDKDVATSLCPQFEVTDGTITVEPGDAIGIIDPEGRCVYTEITPGPLTPTSGPQDSSPTTDR
ncbi:MAG: hypothetical protein LBK59_08190 [Bifidobacteriaceae bacterium]|jgi:hypothetical protein|nr:hypothetical protein [Bifidobacteriaceae bacterium]